MSDKIAEIRARYAGYSLNSGNAGKANEDRGWLLAEAERMRAENERLHRALFRIAGKAPFADDPWTIAAKAMKREAKP